MVVTVAGNILTGVTRPIFDITTTSYFLQPWEGIFHPSCGFILLIADKQPIKGHLFTAVRSPEGVTKSDQCLLPSPSVWRRQAPSGGVE